MNKIKFLKRWDTEVFLLEEDTRDALSKRAEQVAEWCASHQTSTMKDVAFSMNSELSSRQHRIAIVAGSIGDLEGKLRHIANRLVDPSCKRINDRSGMFYFDQPLRQQGRVAFLFPGEGSQYPYMLSDLCLYFPEVRACFDLLDRAFYGQDTRTLPSQFIFPSSSDQGTPGASEDRLWQMDGAVESVFIANQALLALLEQLRVVPDVVLGHSTGEYNALVACGAIRLEDEEELIRHLRDGNQLSQQLLAEGRISRGVLLSAGPVDQALITSILQSRKGLVWLAMDNCPHQIVLFSSESVMTEIVEQLSKAGAVCQKLPFDRAYHTPLFAPVCSELAKFLAKVHITSPEIEIYSCATTTLYPTEPEHIRELILEQWMSTVKFRETVENMYDSGVRVFVEVGPRGNLTAFVDDILRGRPHAAIPANIQHRSGVTQINHLVARLFAHSIPLDLNHLYTYRDPQGGLFDRESTSRPLIPTSKLALSLPIATVSYTKKEQGSARNGSKAVTTSPDSILPVALPLVPGNNASSGADITSGSSEFRSSVMGEYLKTMERFLTVQASVITTFLEGDVSNIESLRIEPTPLPHTVLPQAQPDLNLDNLQIASPTELPLSVYAASPAMTNNETSLDSTQAILLRIVMDRTGYPLEMLSLSADLEADLGIDSIKRVEILGAFQRETAILAGKDLELALELKTLNQIIDFVERHEMPAPNDARPETMQSDGQVATYQLEPAATQEEVNHQAPFVGTIVSLIEGSEIHTTRVFDLNEDLFLKDHALGGSVSAVDQDLHALVVLPLAISVESLAQVASLLMPNKPLLAIREIWAHRWIPFEDSQVTVAISAHISPHSPFEINAVLTNVSEEISNKPAVEATIVFGDPIAPKITAPFQLSNPQPPHWSPDQLYSEIMFHGPAFQGVTSVDRLGEDGIQATLTLQPERDLFQIPDGQAFLTRPSLLDAAGQLVGFWTAACLSAGYVVFPFHVKSIDMYGSPSGKAFSGRARIKLIGNGQVAADIEVLDSENAVRVQINAWEDKRVFMPNEFFRFRMSPADVLLSSAWPSILAQLPEGHHLACYQYESKDTLFRTEGGIWRSVLAHLILSREERKTWRAMQKALDQRRTQWLLGRVVAKDAVRAVIQEKLGIHLYPTDIEISKGKQGQPLVSGKWMEQKAMKLMLSIAHIDGCAVALVSDDARYSGLGIDIERRHSLKPEHTQFILADAERRVIEQLGVVLDDWILRLWCAKEAVGKALGSGLGGGPANLMVRDIEMATGAVYLEVSSGFASECPDAVGRLLTAYTICEGDLAAAIAWRA